MVNKLHFNPYYVDSLAPIERDLYLQFAEEDQKKQEQEQAPKEMLLGTPIDPLNSPLAPPKPSSSINN